MSGTVVDYPMDSNPLRIGAAGWSLVAIGSLIGSMRGVCHAFASWGEVMPER